MTWRLAWAGAGLYRRDLATTFGPLPVWDYGYASTEGRVTVTVGAPSVPGMGGFGLVVLSGLLVVAGMASRWRRTEASRGRAS